MRILQWRRAVPLLTIGLALGACARPDPRLNDLTKGITRDSMITVMGMDNPRRIDPFLINGQYIEAMYFAKPGADPQDSIPDSKLSPVVVVNGTLVGWGWKEWDSIATANKIVLTR
ncbi:MAG: hypothetical protein ACT4PM_09690 [Gemmatimonadales bacterium]